MKRMAQIVLFLTFTCAGTTAAQAADGHAQAAQTFRARCVSCHQPPDLAFRTDVAWLDQVNRTG